MATENALIKVRNRTVEIKWVSQYCDRVMDRFINEKESHDLNFQQIATLLKAVRILRIMTEEDGTGIILIVEESIG